MISKQKNFTNCLWGALIVFTVIETFVYLPISYGIVWFFTLSAALPIKIALPALGAGIIFCICIATKAIYQAEFLAKVQKRFPKWKTKEVAKGVHAYNLIFAAGTLGAILMGVMLIVGGVTARSGPYPYPYNEAQIANKAMAVATSTPGNDLMPQQAVIIAQTGRRWQIEHTDRSLTMKDWVICPVEETHAYKLNPGVAILDIQGKSFDCKGKAIGLHRVVLKITPSASH